MLAQGLPLRHAAARSAGRRPRETARTPPTSVTRTGLPIPISRMVIPKSPPPPGYRRLMQASTCRRRQPELALFQMPHRTTPAPPIQRFHRPFQIRRNEFARHQQRRPRVLAVQIRERFQPRAAVWIPAGTRTPEQERRPARLPAAAGSAPRRLRRRAPAPGRVGNLHHPRFRRVLPTMRAAAGLCTTTARARSATRRSMGNWKYRLSAAEAARPRHSSAASAAVPLAVVVDELLHVGRLRPAAPAENGAARRRAAPPRRAAPAPAGKCPRAARCCPGGIAPRRSAPAPLRRARAAAAPPAAPRRNPPRPCARAAAGNRTRRSRLPALRTAPSPRARTWSLLRWRPPGRATSPSKAARSPCRSASSRSRRK